MTRTRDELRELVRTHDVDGWGTGAKITIPIATAKGDKGMGEIALFFYPSAAVEADPVDLIKDLQYTCDFVEFAKVHPVTSREDPEGWARVVKL